MEVKEKKVESRFKWMHEIRVVGCLRLDIRRELHKWGVIIRSGERSPRFIVITKKSKLQLTVKIEAETLGFNIL